MASTFALQNADLSDRKAFSELAILANLDNPYAQLIWGHVTPEERIRGSSARFPSKILAEGAWFMKLCEGEKTIATAEWELPLTLWNRMRNEHSLEVTDQEQALYQKEYAASVDAEDWPLGARKEAANAVSPAMREARKAFPQDREYILLDQLKTLHEHRRRGAASMLLQWGLDLADREGLPVCLIAWPLGLSLYEKHGFRKVREVVLDLSKFGGTSDFEWVFMIRDPKSS